VQVTALQGGGSYRVFKIEQHGTDEILPHGSDTVGEHDPAFIGLQGGAAVTDLNKLPGMTDVAIPGRIRQR